MREKAEERLTVLSQCGDWRVLVSDTATFEQRLCAVLGNYSWHHEYLKWEKAQPKWRKPTLQGFYTYKRYPGPLATFKKLQWRGKKLEEVRKFKCLGLFLAIALYQIEFDCVPEVSSLVEALKNNTKYSELLKLLGPAETLVVEVSKRDPFYPDLEKDDDAQSKMAEARDKSILMKSSYSESSILTKLPSNNAIQSQELGFFGNLSNALTPPQSINGSGAELLDLFRSTDEWEQPFDAIRSTDGWEQPFDAIRSTDGWEDLFEECIVNHWMPNG